MMDGNLINPNQTKSMLIMEGIEGITILKSLLDKEAITQEQFDMLKK